MRPSRQAGSRGRTGRAAHLLAENPAIAGYDLRTAVVLGDTGRVAAMVVKDPGLAIRPDPGSGWPPLLGVCMSRWHRIDPARSDGLAAVAALLPDAGADADTAVGSRPGQRQLLLEVVRRGRLRGPFGGDEAAAGARRPPGRSHHLRGRVPPGHACLRLLLEYAGLPGERNALGAPPSTGHKHGARLLLEAGADANRPLPGSLFGEAYPDELPIRPVAAAVQFDGPPELTQLVLGRGGDPDTAGWDGRSSYGMAPRRSRSDVAAVLLRHGARDDVTDIDQLLDACLRADRVGTDRVLGHDPGLRGRPTGDDHAVLVRAADYGEVDAVRTADARFRLPGRHPRQR